MKEVVRLSTFETNSSSTHSFAFKSKDDKDYEKCLKCIGKIKDSFDILVAVIGAAEKIVHEAWVWYFDGHIEGNSYLFVKKLWKLNNKAKISDYLRNSDVIHPTAYDEYKCLVNDEMDVYDLFVEREEAFIYFFRYNRYMEVAIKTYADVLGLNEEDVKERLAKLEVNDDDYICRTLFEEGPLSDCYCGIDYVFENIKNEQEVEKLMRDLLSDKLTIFCCESFGSTTINDILENPDEDWC